MDSNNGSHSEALPWKNHACTALYLYGCWYWKKYLNYACHIRHNIIMYVQWNPHVGNQADTSLLQPTYTCTLSDYFLYCLIFSQVGPNTKFCTHELTLTYTCYCSMSNIIFYWPSAISIYKLQNLVLVKHSSQNQLNTLYWIMEVSYFLQRSSCVHAIM